MLQTIKKIFGDKNEKTINRLWPIVEKINEHFDSLSSLTDEELRAKTDEFKGRIRDAQSEIENDIEEIEAQLKSGHKEERTDAVEAGQQDRAQNGQDDDHELSYDDRMRLFEELDELDEEWHRVLDETLDELLPEAFAVAKEACRRMVGKSWIAGGQEILWEMVPFDVQLLGAITLHRGNIAEMKTGEGKTLVAVPAVYLNSLAGQGVQWPECSPRRDICSLYGENRA